MRNAIIEQGEDWNFPFNLDRKKVEEIRLRVTIKYAADYAKASWWGKRMINFKISREVAKELRAFDPRYRV